MAGDGSRVLARAGAGGLDDDLAGGTQQILAVVAIASLAIVVVIVVAIDTDILELAQALGDALVEVAVAGQVGLRLLPPGVHFDAEGVVLELRQECTRVLEVLAPGKREEVSVR